MSAKPLQVLLKQSCSHWNQSLGEERMAWIWNENRLVPDVVDTASSSHWKLKLFWNIILYLWHLLFIAFYLAWLELAEYHLQMHLAPVSSGWQQHNTEALAPMLTGVNSYSLPEQGGQAPQHEFNWMRKLCFASVIPDGFDTSQTTITPVSSVMRN